MGAAVGSFTGCLDLDAAAGASAPLRGTLAALEAAAGGAVPAAAGDDDTRPLEEAFLTRRLQEAARGGSPAPPRRSRLTSR